MWEGGVLEVVGIVMVIDLRCKLMGLREEGEGRAKLTHVVSGMPSTLHVVALLQVSDQGSVSEERISRLKKQKGRAGFGACGSQGAFETLLRTCRLRFWD